MKQNERILVYAVTGFLAIILAVAVLFGRDAAAKTNPATGAGEGDKKVGVMSFEEALKHPKQIAESKREGTPTDGKPSGDNVPVASLSGLQPPTAIVEQPLVANSKPVVQADILAQKLGPSVHDRMVRIVRAQAGDSLESLVRRWCGARDPFLDDAKRLNEDLTVVRLGQEISVPWVDDEVVLAAYEARQPRTLVAESGANGTPNPSAVPTTLPTFATPGSGASHTESTKEKSDGGKSGVGKPESGKPAEGGLAAGAVKTYVVKSGDSLWKIAEQLYGRKNADRMVAEIRRLNPGKTERLQPDQKLSVPGGS